MDLSKISLSFTKKLEKKVIQKSVFNPKEIKDDSNLNKHSLLSFDGDTKLPTPKDKEELVIPMIDSHREAVYKKLLKASRAKQKDSTNTSATSDNQVEDLDQIAANALIEDSKKRLEELHKRPEDTLTIRVKPNDELISESLANTDTGTISSLDDYEEVNIDAYGAALLRGMGWKKDEGIGKLNKRVVNIVEPTSKGFGLSKNATQNSSDSNQNATNNDDEEEEPLSKGAYVFIEGGRNRGVYGIVETVDEDHILIKPARGGDSIIREVEQNIRRVSSKEFKDSSRVINKEMYDKFKNEEIRQKEKRRQERKEKYDNGNDKDSKSDRENRRKEYRDSRRENTKREEVSRDIKSNIKLENSDALNDNCTNKSGQLQNIKPTNTDEVPKCQGGFSEGELNALKNIVKKNRPTEESFLNYEKEPKRMKSDEASRGKSYDDHKKMSSKKESKLNRASESKSNITWVRPNLRVRIIDKKYKRGNYHKEKVIVRDVESSLSCSCITSEGSTIWDVNPSKLETVIPKTPSATIFILKGKYKGKKGRILILHKEEEKASVQLLGNESVIEKFLYDDICEYVQNI